MFHFLSDPQVQTAISHFVIAVLQLVLAFLVMRSNGKSSSS